MLPQPTRPARPGWDDYWLAGAKWVSSRADCTRRKAGALIVKDNLQIGAGYNGAPPGEPGCLTDGACPRGRHFMIRTPTGPSGWVYQCGCGGVWPCQESVQPMSSYDTGVGSCIAVHAEANAIMRADWTALRGASLYLYPGEPCDGCWRLIRGSGIVQVFWPDGRWVKENGAQTYSISV